MDDDNKNSTEDGNIWAVLVATSKGWENYRHQADVSHAYHTLINHGVEKKRIITMMVDDIANNTENTQPGKIFNVPHGEDVYEGVKIDYRGHEVNPQNFMAILLGDEKRTKGKPVLKSTGKDKVFVYTSGHGDFGFLIFPKSELTVKQLTRTLKTMHEKKMYAEMTLYIEACKAGSMFFETLKKEWKIYAVTASNPYEFSYATFCDPDFLDGECLGDLFSVNWMRDSAKANLSKETLRVQFEIVRKKTNESHVMKYGDLTIQSENIAEFMGKKQAQKRNENHHSAPFSQHKFLTIPSRAASLLMLHKKRQNESQQDRHNIQHEERSVVEQQIKQIVHKLVQNANDSQRILTKHPKRIGNLDCHDEVVHTFGNSCFNFSENLYALEYAYVLANLCEQSELDTERIKKVLMEQCAGDKLTEKKTA
ncbi:hypothetical protein niasHT_014026 [Heterodera trifolii]|uniref:legumain n=1 Tax=Heterodera trifolii TaxID=157864 RepID=A0ABD2KYH6_9BILA